jgi:hypothetical protein
MQRRLALKRLTASDLTLFEWQFRNRPAGNQKSINLNSDVFIDELFPSLPAVATSSNGRIPLDLSIYGPGHAGIHNVQRKILKGVAYKNWRLDGEYINNPENHADRYNVLQPDDLAIFSFQGAVIPSSAKLVLLARGLPADQAIYYALLPLLGRRSMVSVSADQLQARAAGIIDADHPFNQLTLDAELEDAALGGAKGSAALRSRRLGRAISREDLAHARQAANEIGLAGEEIVFEYLDRLKENGSIAAFRWEAEMNAVAPYDFLVTTLDNEEIAIDVKATAGAFERPIHISQGELTEMTSGRRYDLYRVFEVTETGGKLRIAQSVGAFASAVLQGFAGLPAGVVVDSVSVAPSALRFAQLTVDVVLVERDV